MAVRRGLRIMALLHEDTVFFAGIARGTADLAAKRGPQIVAREAHARNTTDFSAIPGPIRTASPEVLAAATDFDGAVAVTRQLRAPDVDPKRFGVTVGGDLPKFSEGLGWSRRR